MSNQKISIVDNLKNYLANATEEQLQRDWEELKEWNEVGPNVFEFLEELGFPINKK